MGEFYLIKRQLINRKNQYPVAPQYQYQSQEIIQQPISFNNQKTQNLFGGQKDYQNPFEEKVYDSITQNNNNSNNLSSFIGFRQSFTQDDDLNQAAALFTAVGVRPQHSYQRVQQISLFGDQSQQWLDSQSLQRNSGVNLKPHSELNQYPVAPQYHIRSQVVVQQPILYNNQNSQNLIGVLKDTQDLFGKQMQQGDIQNNNNSNDLFSFIGGSQSFTKDEDLNQAASLFTAVGVKPQQLQKQLKQISLFDDQSQQQLGSQSLQRNSDVNRKTNSEYEKKKISLLKKNMRSYNSNLRID